MSNSDQGRVTVLVVEDSDSDAELFEMVLQEAAPGAFAVTRAATLAEAISHVERDGVECAVVDLGLPDAEGLDVITALVARAPAMALVVLTGREDDEIGLATVEAGASDYFPKSSLDGKLIARSIRHAIVRKRLETSLAEAQSIARIGSWEVDIAPGNVTWSRELYRLFDFDTDEKPSYEALIERTHPDDRDAAVAAIVAAMDESTPFSIEHRILFPDETVRWVRARGRVELDAAGQPSRLFGTAQDISAQKAAEEALQHQAFHDVLTGLPNRLLFLDRLGHALTRLGRAPSTLAVIYVDIDRFQVINDSLGHTVGDQLLTAMATRLIDFLRPADTLARVGSDEFVMLCEALSGEAEAVTIADRICAAMTGPLAWEGGELVISVSAGVALATSPSADPDSVLRDADAAMYRAKREGRARSAVFAEDMRAKAIGRLDTEVALRHALVNDELRLHYQTIVSLIDGQILGHEALARWQHPTRGLLEPAHFIDIAEETGLIVPLGAWVVREACVQAKRFQQRDAKWSELTMSVNLSGGQLGQPDLVELIASALRDADLEPEYLQLEMTESILMGHAAATITILQTLKGLGVKLGVDDFGTGYSSLAYLKRFPVDVLKIDRSFVSGLGMDPEDSAIAAAVVGLAGALGVTVTAEGVESGLQRGCLIALGCARAQGYLFARPVAAPVAEAALDRAAGPPLGRHGAMAAATRAIAT